MKDTDSDYFLIGGTAQPTAQAGIKMEVGAFKGSDGASLFGVVLSDDGFGDAPRGTSEAFTIGKGDDALVGKNIPTPIPRTR